MKLDEACQNCAYWQAKKGSFGVCKTFPERKAYDGSRKGSACIGWRISNNNINQLHTKKVYKSNSVDIKPPEYKSLRGLYNSLHKPKFKATYATNVDGEFITYTSDIHTKNGYYKHRYNYTLIDVTLTLFLQGKNYGDIVRHMNNNYMKPMSRRSFLYWIEKFLGKNAFYEHPYYKKYYIEKEKIIKIPKICSVEGCKETHLAKGYCRLHYQRWKAHGDPLKIVKKGKNPLICIIAGCENKKYPNDSLCKKHGNYPLKTADRRTYNRLEMRKLRAIALLKSMGITTLCKAPT